MNARERQQADLLVEALKRTSVLPAEPLAPEPTAGDVWRGVRDRWIADSHELVGKQADAGRKLWDAAKKPST